MCQKSCCKCPEGKEKIFCSCECHKEKDYIVHLKSFRIKATSEEEAQKEAEKKLKKGFKLPDLMIEEVEEDEEQF